jgi:GDP-L-fucose synthase
MDRRGSSDLSRYLAALLEEVEAFAQDRHRKLTGCVGTSFPRYSHVIPAVIRKILAAKQHGDEAVEVWGDGSASREFLYVDDAAEAIGLATERHEGSDPVNHGAGREITIKNLVTVLCDLIGYEGQIRWDTTKPNGQPRRSLDVGRAEKAFGFRARTDFETGLRRTVEWWAQQEAAQTDAIAERGQPAPVA